VADAGARLGISPGSGNADLKWQTIDPWDVDVIAVVGRPFLTQLRGRIEVAPLIAATQAGRGGQYGTGLGRIQRRPSWPAACLWPEGRRC